MNNPEIDFKIRKALVTDVNLIYDAVLQIHIDLKLDISSFRETFKLKMNSNDFWIYIIENQNNFFIGMICAEKYQSLFKKHKTLVIREFYIHPKYRKYNYAYLLYNFIEEKAMQQGIFNFEVACNINSTTTQNFYIKNSFKYQKKQYIKQI